MELRHLRYFVAVAEVLHFGRAAAQLRIAQPSLSQQVRQLEAELQTTLLERTNRRVRLTEPGRLFLKEAREILAHADHAAVIARRAHRGEIGRLRVGFAYWMDYTNVVAMIKRLDERGPAIRVELQTMSVPLQIVALRDERLDVGFVLPPVAEPSLLSRLLVSEPFIVALPKNHRRAGSQRIPLPALADEQYIVFPREAVPLFYDLTLRLCRDSGFVPHVRDEVDHPDTLFRLVAAGIGISLVPASARKVPRPGVAFRSLRPSPRILQTALAWRRDNSSPLVKEFLEVAQEMTAAGGRKTR